MHVCFARFATQGHITYGLLFPIPEPILNILADLGLSLTQMCPNFLRHLLALLVKNREEGLLFCLEELRHLVLMKRNSQNPGTFLMSPRPGRQIIQGVPYRDQDWREEFFVFKIDEASVGSSDFSSLPRYWAEDIGEFLFGIFGFTDFCMCRLFLIDYVFFFVCSSSFVEIRYDRWASGVSRSSPERSLGLVLF